MTESTWRQAGLSLLRDDDLARIHALSLDLLEQNGVTMPSERALTLLRRHGFRTDGAQVYMTAQQVQQALDTAPTHFLLRGRNPAHNLDLGGGDCGIPGPIGPVSVTDLERGKRPAALQDVENFIKLYQASRVVNINSNSAAEANDIPEGDRHLYVMRALLRHTDKPFYTRLFDYRRMHEAIDMIELATGETLRPGGPVYLSAGSTPSLSPLAWSGDTLDNIIALAERGQAVTTGTAISTGITGPMRIFGTLVLQNAELLSGIVLTQLVNPGNPVGYGSAATSGNMRGAKYCCGSPERVLLQIGSIEMGKRYYHLPTRTWAYCTDAVQPDVQAGIESYEHTMGCLLAGADYMLSEIGTVDAILTTSYEKTILDEEITDRLLYLRRGIDVSDEAASIDTILEVGSGGEYLTSDDTLDHYGDGWYPFVTDWNGGAPEADQVLRRANAIWKQRLAEAPTTLLDPAAEQALTAYLEQHRTG